MLTTAAHYVAQTRVLVQDAVAPYRYSDNEILAALSLGMLEARRLRPDLFVGRADAVPSFIATSDAVVFDPQYRSALVYYAAGHVTLRDAEASATERSVAFMNKFAAQLQVQPS